jgi:hypothetical protein
MTRLTQLMKKMMTMTPKRIMPTEAATTNHHFLRKALLSLAQSFSLPFIFAVCVVLSDLLF